MRLRSRIVPPGTYADSRLLGVSLPARALALALESLAEDTGVLSSDVREIRTVAGMWLSADGDTLPTVAEIAAWIAELREAGWLREYQVDGLHLAYLKGFGERQQGPSVGIGRSKATGEASPHLPLPPFGCVALDTSEKWHTANRFRPVHCDRPYTACDACAAEQELAASQLQQPKEEPEAEPLGESLDESVDEALEEGSPREGATCSFCGGKGFIQSSQGDHPCPDCKSKGKGAGSKGKGGGLR